MSTTPTFENPPIVEFVLGVQFDAIAGFTAAHFGRYWDRLGSAWGNPRDNGLIGEQFERFGGSANQRRWRMKMEPAPLVNRLTLINQSTSDRLIQIQPTRFHLNWRKTENLKPSYKELIEEFESKFEQFKTFCEDEKIGPVNVNQWEVTYVDSFPQDEYWSSPNDWHKFLPGLFSDKPSELAGSLKMVKRNVQWTMEIEPQLGRLHLSSGIGCWDNNAHESLMLDITARGPVNVECTPTYRAGLDLGHKVAVGQFLAMVDSKTKASWGEVK